MLKCPHCDSEEFFVFTRHRITVSESEILLEEGKLDPQDDEDAECVECGHSASLEVFRKEGEKDGSGESGTTVDAE